MLSTLAYKYLGNKEWQTDKHSTTHEHTPRNHLTPEYSVHVYSEDTNAFKIIWACLCVQNSVPLEGRVKLLGGVAVL
jgi:hypothetical protein